MLNSVGVKNNDVHIPLIIPLENRINPSSSTISNIQNVANTQQRPSCQHQSRAGDRHNNSLFQYLYNILPWSQAKKNEDNHVELKEIKAQDGNINNSEESANINKEQQLTFIQKYGPSSGFLKAAGSIVGGCFAGYVLTRIISEAQLNSGREGENSKPLRFTLPETDAEWIDGKNRTFITHEKLTNHSLPDVSYAVTNDESLDDLGKFFLDNTLQSNGLNLHIHTRDELEKIDNLKYKFLINTESNVRKILKVARQSLVKKLYMSEN